MRHHSLLRQSEKNTFHPLNLIGTPFRISLILIFQLISFRSSSRIATLEMLDEIEELELVLEHYVISWGIKVAPDRQAECAPFLAWGLKFEETAASE
jgi:hypothetical protein